MAPPGGFCPSTMAHGSSGARTQAPRRRRTLGPPASHGPGHFQVERADWPTAGPIPIKR
jgi:hypothetical protein